MISSTGLYSILIKIIKELTGINVYQNYSSKWKIVDAKWLFVKIVHFLFENRGEELIHLKKPTHVDLAFQLGYKDSRSIRNLLNNYSPVDKNIDKKLQIIKDMVIEYTDIKISKEGLRKLIMDGKFTLTDVIDEVIEINGLVGVGILTLGDNLKQYCYNKTENEKI